jgi:hypothetical protein
MFPGSGIVGAGPRRLVPDAAAAAAEYLATVSAARVVGARKRQFALSTKLYSPLALDSSEFQ